MGTLTNMIAIYAFAAIFLYAAGIQTPFTDFAEGTTSWNEAIEVVTSNAALAAGVAIVASLIFSGGGVIYLLIVPLVVILLTFLTFPLSLFGAGGFPPEVADFLKLIYTALNIIMALAIVGWWKGSE